MSVANNECEGSQERTELRYLTLAPSGVNRWFGMTGSQGLIIMQK